MRLSNRAYDILKLVSVLATDIGIFVATVTDQIGLHNYGVIIAEIIAAIGILCGAIITKSSQIYKAEHNLSDGTEHLKED